MTAKTSRASAREALTAAAATIRGLIRSVRPVGEPCRHLKLRLEELAQSWSPMGLYGFIVCHLAHPPPAPATPSVPVSW